MTTQHNMIMPHHEAVVALQREGKNPATHYKLMIPHIAHTGGSEEKNHNKVMTTHLIMMIAPH